MSEYIDKQDAIDIFKQFKKRKWISMPIEQVIEIISVVPYVEAEPIKHGRWVYVKTIINGEKEYKCSECNAPLYCYGTPKQAHYEWCYSCGTRMDERSNER